MMNMPEIMLLLVIGFCVGSCQDPAMHNRAERAEQLRTVTQDKSKTPDEVINKCDCPYTPTGRHVFGYAHDGTNGGGKYYCIYCLRWTKMGNEELPGK